VGNVASSVAIQTSIGEENAVPAARSLVYSELADAFRHPSTPVAMQRLSDGSAERELMGLVDGVAQQLPGHSGTPLQLEVGRGEAADDGVDVLYCSLFDAALGKAAVSLHERDHGSMGREPLWEDLFRCYAHFGLELEAGGLREAPDHLTIELEFMHFLTFLEASSSDGARGLVLCQRDFLARHLDAWVPRMYELIAKRSGGSVYHHIAHVLRDFVSADRAYLESRTRDLRRSSDDTHSPR